VVASDAPTARTPISALYFASSASPSSAPVTRSRPRESSWRTKCATASETQNAAVSSLPGIPLATSCEGRKATAANASQASCGRSGAAARCTRAASHAVPRLAAEASNVMPRSSNSALPAQASGHAST